MMISLDFPEDILIAAIRRLSPAKRKRMMTALQSESDNQPIRLVVVPASSLNKLDGLVDIGGDALIDSERLYE